MQVVVGDPEKQGGLTGYFTYRVTTKTTLSHFVHSEVTVRRRFREVEWLWSKLHAEYPAVRLPELPSSSFFGRFRPDAEKQRLQATQSFMSFVAADPVLQRHKLVQLFCERSGELNDETASSALLEMEYMAAAMSAGSNSTTTATTATTTTTTHAAAAAAAAAAASSRSPLLAAPPVSPASGARHASAASPHSQSSSVVGAASPQSPTQSAVTLDEREYRVLLGQLRDCPFASGRAELIKQLAENAPLATSHISGVFDALPFSSERVAAARILVPLLEDQSRATRLVGMLRFEHERQAVRELLDAAELSRSSREAQDATPT